MVYLKSATPVRRFILVTGPNVADPAWQIPVYEVDWEGNVIKSYTDASEVLKVATQIQEDLKESAIRTRATEDVLLLLGVSREEYHAKVWEKMKREKQEADELAHQIATAENEGM